MRYFARLSRTSLNSLSISEGFGQAALEKFRMIRSTSVRFESENSSEKRRRHVADFLAESCSDTAGRAGDVVVRRLPGSALFQDVQGQGHDQRSGGRGRRLPRDAAAGTAEGPHGRAPHILQPIVSGLLVVHGRRDGYQLRPDRQNWPAPLSAIPARRWRR